MNQVLLLHSAGPTMTFPPSNQPNHQQGEQGEHEAQPERVY